MNELKKKIQEANPEIMELKFGCEIELIDTEYGSELFNAVVIAKNWSGFFYIPFENWSKNPLGSDKYHFHDEPEQREFQQLKILGRPIRLADVLLALQKMDTKPRDFGKKIGYCDFEEFKLDEMGDFRITYKQQGCRCSYDCADRHLLFATWNLKDDNLDNQSEETINFLKGLLL